MKQEQIHPLEVLPVDTVVTIKNSPDYGELAGKEFKITELTNWRPTIQGYKLEGDPTGIYILADFETAKLPASVRLDKRSVNPKVYKWLTLGVNTIAFLLLQFNGVGVAESVAIILAVSLTSLLWGYKIK